MTILIVESPADIDAPGTLWRGRDGAPPFLLTVEQLDSAVLDSSLYGEGCVISIGRELWPAPAPQGLPDAPILFSAAQEPAEGYEEDFHNWMTQEHLPALAAVPGVIGARWYVLIKGSPRYLALYFLADADVVVSEEWKSPGRSAWASRLMPHRVGRTFRLFERAL